MTAQPDLDIKRRGPVPADLTGREYGRWMVLRFAGRDKSGNRLWLCICSGCGKEKPVQPGHLTGGLTHGCASCSVTRHGHAKNHNGKKARTKACHAWHDMKQRCYNSENSGFHNYGGRGIAVCEHWRADFSAFLADMGEPPGPGRGWSLDRIDYNGNYEPGNCRWATSREQARNTRHVKLNTEAVKVIRFFGLMPRPQRHSRILAALHGVNLSYLSAIRAGVTWKEEASEYQQCAPITDPGIYPPGGEGSRWTP